jgi:hypothetical protein
MNATKPRLVPTAPREESLDEAELFEAVKSAAAGLRYGSIEIVVHDGRIAQVIRTEKRRIVR